MNGATLGPRDPAPPPDHPVGLGEDSGPNPVVRAVVGLLVGLGAGALAAALTPRPDRARRTSSMTGGG